MIKSLRNSKRNGPKRCRIRPREEETTAAYEAPENSHLALRLQAVKPNLERTYRIRPKYKNDTTVQQALCTDHAFSPQRHQHSRHPKEKNSDTERHPNRLLFAFVPNSAEIHLHCALRGSSAPAGDQVSCAQYRRKRRTSDLDEYVSNMTIKQ